MAKKADTTPGVDTSLSETDAPAAEAETVTGPDELPPAPPHEILEPVRAPEPEPEPVAVPEPPATQPPTPPVPPVAAPPVSGEQSSSGFWAGLVGGVFASAIAFGAYWTVDRSDAPDLLPLTSGLEEQSGRTDTLAGEVAALKAEVEGLRSAPVAGDGQEARLGTLEADLAARIDTLAGEVDRQGSTLTVLEGRLAQVEARPPVFEGDASEATGELIAQMRAALEAQRTEIGTLADEARARLESVEAEAATLQQNAEAAARASTARAALSRLKAALDAGGPYAGPLADLAETTGQTMPDALTAYAESGVWTLSQLRETFPDAARAALSATAQDGLSGDAGAFDRIGAFLAAQTGARSLEPREGDSPDAVLSRTEAALAEGRLDDALALLDELPPAGQEAMAAWRTEADARQAAVAAAAALTIE